MKLKYFIIILSALSVLVHAQDARTRAYIHTVLGDSTAVVRTDMLNEGGTNPLADDWAAGDYDITGLEKVEADSLTINTDATITGNVIADSVDAQHVVADVHVATDSLDVQHIAADVHITTDSIDAQHLVADVHVQTDSIQSNHVVLVANPIVWTTFRDTATVVFNDSVDVVVRIDGTNAMTANWASGDFDITGLNRLEADTVEATPIYTGKITTGAIPGMLDLTEASFLNAAPIVTDSLDAQHVVSDISIVTDSLCFDKMRCNPTATVIDSFKLVSDTLRFYVGGKGYRAVP